MLVYVLLIGALLVGCVDDEKDEEEVVQLPRESTEPIAASKGITIRPEISIVINENETSLPATVRSIRDKFCWESEEKQCSLEPTPSRELLEHEQSTRVRPEEDLTFRFSRPKEDFDFPKPDSFKIYVDEDEEMKEAEVVDNQIKAPLNEGRYYMSVKAIWSSEVKGEAIYAFSLLVKEE